MKKYVTGILAIAFLLIEIVFTLSNGHAFLIENKGAKANCSQCHTMTAEEAGNILYQIDPAMNVSNVMESLSNGFFSLVGCVI